MVTLLSSLSLVIGVGMEVELELIWALREFAATNKRDPNLNTEPCPPKDRYMHKHRKRHKQACTHTISVQPLQRPQAAGRVLKALRQQGGAVRSSDRGDGSFVTSASSQRPAGTSESGRSLQGL
jgi:hypothetical protein